MSGSGTLATRPGVQWSEALTTEYFQGTPLPSAGACNAAIIEVVGLADRLVAGPELMNADRTAWVLPRTPGTDGTIAPGAEVEVGRYLSRAVLTGDSDREIAALALAQIASDIHASTLAPAMGVHDSRRAGIAFVHIAVGLALVTLVGAAVAWYCDRQTTTNADARVAQGANVEAARLTAERYRRAAETGQPIAPPSELETAAAANLRALADRARAAGFGQQVEQAAGAIGKAFAVIVGGILLLQLLKKG